MLNYLPAIDKTESLLNKMENFAQRGKKARKMPTSQAQLRSVTLQKGPSDSPLLPPSSSRNMSRPMVKKVIPPMQEPIQPTSPLQQPQSSSPPLQQQSSHSQDSEPVSSEAYNFSGKKRTRGKSRGKGVHNMIEANDGKKVPVAFDFVLEVPDNIEVSSKFSSEIGSIVRVHAHVQHDGWKNVPLEDKRLLHEKLSVLFDVDLAHPKIDEYVDGKMSKAYTSLKWRLHRHYLAYKTPQEGRANLPHADLWNERPESHWHWLCDNVYTDPRWVEIARKNANNRNKQKYPHKGGSRPFIQHAKKAAKEGAQFSMIDNWETVHKDKNKQWVHDDAREKYDKMKRMRDEHKEKLIAEAPEDTPLDSIQLPMEAELEIMSKTLGRKGRSIYGVGSFPRLETTKSFATSSMASKSELAEIQNQVKLLATSYKIMQQENEKLKAQVTALLTSQGKSSGHSNEPNNYQADDDDDPYEDELADYA